MNLKSGYIHASMSRLIVILCLAPGAVITIYSLVTAYSAMGEGAEVDAERLRAGVERGLAWSITGLVLAAVLLFLLFIYRLVRPRRRRIE